MPIVTALCDHGHYANRLRWIRLLAGGELLQRARLQDGEGDATRLNEAFPSEPAEGTRDGFAGSGRHRGEFVMGERHGDGGALAFTASHPVKEQAGDATSGSLGKRDAAGLLEGGVALFRESLCDADGSCRVVVEKCLKDPGAHDTDTTRLERLGRCFVRDLRERGAEAEDRPGCGDAQDHGAAFLGGGGDLDPAGAEHVDRIAVFALAKHHGTAGVFERHGVSLEKFASVVVELAEGVLVAVGAA